MVWMHALSHHPLHKKRQRKSLSSNSSCCFVLVGPGKAMEDMSLDELDELEDDEEEEVLLQYR